MHVNISELVSVFICFITGTWYLTIPSINIISTVLVLLVFVLSFYYFLLILYIFCVAAHDGEINFILL